MSILFRLSKLVKSSLFLYTLGMSRFGELLDYHIVTKQLLKQDVAKVLGIDPSYLAKMISGDRPPPNVETFKTLVDILHLNHQEELAFYMSAIEKKTPERIRPFMAMVEELSERAARAQSVQSLSRPHTFLDDRTQRIPILKMPSHYMHAPYPPHLIMDWFVNNDIVNEGYFAIKGDQLRFAPKEFGPHDLVLIDPDYKELKTGDYVLVKLDSKVTIKHIKLQALDKKEKSYIVTFFPADETDSSVYTYNDKGKSDIIQSIFGKVVFSLKRY